ncbi:DUF5329 domain-containing protein [Dyella sp. EPa41]|uniref:DUF5329 family protein n=1 Tax=Dyella sp. EPa41 TaxID=1561194 RepID=UPI001F19D3E3|nr:DUF5329 domain-containing protein [Dyella sp. EPa41]
MAKTRMPSTRLAARLLGLAMGTACAATAHADLDATGQREVQALLAFVGSSHCTFIRNGKAYDAEAARNHLQYKLDYLVQRHKVNSAEEFIERAGTDSSFSGKPYRVNCDGTERLSADWLREELQRLRATPP